MKAPFVSLPSSLAVGLFLCCCQPMTVCGQHLVSGHVSTTDSVVPYGISIQAHNVDIGSGTIPVAHTDATGHYAFSLPVGTYKFYADPSYAIYGPPKAYAKYRPEWYDDEFFYSEATALAVGPGITNSTVDFVLSRYAEISGRVISAATQNPIMGVNVGGFETASDTQIGGVLQTVTDSNGKYALYVNTGTWRICANPEGLGYALRYYSNKVNQADANLLTVELEGVLTNINFALPTVTYGTICGTVCLSDGSPLAGASIDAYGNNYSGSATANAAGYYQMTTLQADSYSVSVYHPDYPRQYYFGQWQSEFAHRVSISGGLIKSNINFRLPVTAQISGTVTNAAGQPVAGLRISVWSMGGNNNYDSITTLEDGSYTATRLVPGDFRVYADTENSYENPDAKFYIKQYYSGRSSPYFADLIHVEEGDSVDGIDIGLTLGGILSGVVSNAGGYAAGNVQVYAWPAGADIYSGGSIDIMTAYSGSDGSYQLKGLPRGPYRIQSWGDSYYGRAGSFYDRKLAFEEADVVDLTVTNEYVGVCPLVYSQARLTGTVRNIDEWGLEEVSVYALSTNGTVVGRDNGTDWAGNFLISGLAPGTYVVYAVPAYHNQDFGGSYAPTYYGSSSFAGATRITLAAGETRSGLNMIVSTVSGAISGRVTRACDGVALADVSIYAWTIGNTAVRISSAYTDANGTYLLRAIPSGSYFVQAYLNESDGYARQYYSNKTSRALANVVSVGTGTKTGINFAVPEIAPIYYVTGMTQPLCSTNDQPVVFEWRPLYGARLFDLQVDDLTVGTTGVIRQAGIAGLCWTSTVTLATNHRYRAKVRGGNSAGYGEWGSYLPFTLLPPQPFGLSVNVIGTGSVTLDPPGGSYAPNTVVTLTAVEQGYAFDHWTGVDSNLTAPTAVVTMNMARAVSAFFLANRAPNKPFCAAPPAGYLCGLQPLLQSSIFSDPDPADTHATSHWQVAVAAIGFSAPAYDVKTGPTCTHRVPEGRLVYTNYLWRIRHQDNLAAWSVWSEASAFSTTLTLGQAALSETGDLEVSWPTLSGYLYTLYRTDELTSGDWTPVAGSIDVAGTGGNITRILPTHVDPQAFYRVEMRPAP